MNALPAWLQQIEPVSLLLGLLLGCLPLVWIWQQARQQRRLHEQAMQEEEILQLQIRELEQQLGEHKQTLARTHTEREEQARYWHMQQQQWQQHLQQEKEETAQLRQQYRTLGAQHAALQARYETEQKNWAEKLEQLERLREQMKGEFAELSRRTLEAESESFARQSETRLKQLLAPMQERLQNFQQQISQSREQDMKDRASLQEHIRMLAEENRRVTSEAHALTQALTGQAKTRGNWGERQIECALELSGLQEGREYQREVQLVDDRGQRWRPDVLVHLPEGRSLIIDAKLALNHYIEYVNAEDDASRNKALKKHVQALKLHVKSLAGKRYDRLQEVNSLDFVLMFVPNESAFIEAINAEPSLYDEAFRQHVVIVTTSTLLASLQTIANLWRYEKQQRNAQKMADHAARLYDKFAGFVEDMERVGQRLRQAGDSYSGAMNKLRDGRGNLMRQMESFVELGAQPRKRLKLEDDPGADESGPAGEGREHP